MAVVNPSTRHALRGMTLGGVNREWARHHHRRWVEEIEAARSRRSWRLRWALERSPP
jgi:cytochrome b subunit of formate dehydrogenase